MGCLANLGHGLFPRKSQSTLISSHFAFIDTSKFCKLADIEEIKIIKKRGYIVMIFDRQIINPRSILPFCNLLINSLSDTNHEISLGTRDRVSKSTEIAIA